MKPFRVPDLGEGLQEVEIVEWHVGPGDRVVAGQPLVTVETEKAVVEIAAPWSGAVARVIGEPGDELPVGALLVEFEGADEAEAAGPGRADAGTVVGELPAAPPGAAGAVGTRAAPAVRALARRLGVELGAVTGSGPGGAITSADVEAAAGAQARLEPLRGVRLAMSRNMARAGAEVVPATVYDEADVDAWQAGTDVMARLVRAIVAGARAEPALNAWYDGRRAARLLHADVDLGVALQTDDGLFVPVLRAAGGAGPAELRQRLDALREQVTARSASPATFRGPTFTLSNFGAVGGRFASLVIVPPQVGILGAGRIEPRAVAAEGAVAVHRVLPLSLSFEHRAVTGAEAARFLAAAIADLERPS